MLLIITKHPWSLKLFLIMRFLDSYLLFLVHSNFSLKTRHIGGCISAQESRSLTASVNSRTVISRALSTDFLCVQMFPGSQTSWNCLSSFEFFSPGECISG